VFLGTAAVLASGAAAGAAYQLIDHPLDRIRSAVMIHHTGENTVGFYATAWRRCQRLAYRAGGWQAWLYQGLTTNLIKAVPATSLGLFCYEWMKRRFDEFAEFEKEDNPDWEDDSENMIVYQSDTHSAGDRYWYN
jgi:hypothetical protein